MDWTVFGRHFQMKYYGSEGRTTTTSKTITTMAFILKAFPCWFTFANRNFVHSGNVSYADVLGWVGISRIGFFNWSVLWSQWRSQWRNSRLLCATPTSSSSYTGIRYLYLTYTLSSLILCLSYPTQHRTHTAYVTHKPEYKVHTHVVVRVAEVKPGNVKMWPKSSFFPARLENT